MDFTYTVVVLLCVLLRAFDITNGVIHAALLQPYANRNMMVFLYIRILSKNSYLFAF